ncbi:MAG: GGDEF domain-containing protein [Alphaproteobacteria bacterium]|nr:MAG: GGDEF domain-containing protein [Alphaproteobacteria bacterium]
MSTDPNSELALLRELEAQNQELRTELALARQSIERLEALADEDVLVPVANRRAFIHALIRMKAYDARHGVQLSLIYMDLNDFKNINDAYGHVAGDTVLRFVGQLLLDQFRRSDLVGRLGGDEFAIILANSTQDSAEAKARQVAEILEGSTIPFEGHALKISTAWGVVQVSPNEDVEAALHRADEAMYACKEAQRQKA